MPYTESAGVRLYYEAFGAETDPLLVLVSGGGAQLLSWDEDFIVHLTRAGLRVVRFDNRDTGFSERFGGEEDIDGGYDLADMGDDIVRVLDELGVESAHIAGHSMGGMMAQMVAIQHPERVRSLGLLSTIPGRNPRYVLHGERPELLRPPVRVTREQAVAFAEHAVSSAPPTRYDPQLAWHVAKAADEVLSWLSAVDTAEAITGSELQVQPDMGHLIPHELWPDLTHALLRTARRAEARRAEELR